MPPTAELEFIGNNNATCMIDCNMNDCRCATATNTGQINENADAEMIKSDDDASIETNSSNNSIVKGQVEHLVTALRTLRWSKSKTLISSHNDEMTMVLNNEKCRPIITLKEVAEHDSYDDCWIVLYDRVYDVTKFLNEVNISNCAFFVLSIFKEWNQHFTNLNFQKQKLINTASGWKWCDSWIRRSRCQYCFPWPLTIRFEVVEIVWNRRITGKRAHLSKARPIAMRRIARVNDFPFNRHDLVLKQIRVFNCCFCYKLWLLLLLCLSHKYLFCR